MRMPFLAALRSDRVDGGSLSTEITIARLSHRVAAPVSSHGRLGLAAVWRRPSPN
jgi:hypothetical protein